MTKTRRAGLVLILVSSALSIWWGISLGMSMPGGPLDFQAVYFGSRTLLSHQNPYTVKDLDAVYRNESTHVAEVTPKQHILITLFVNTPATLLVVAPLALIPLGLAQWIWMLFTTSSLVVAAYLMWEITANYEPLVSALLISFLLLNCEVVFASGNTAAIVVGGTIICAWCFVRNRYVTLGIIGMAICLVVKPHDAGFVWLYFFLANRIQRNRALAAAAIACVIAIPAIVWISSVAPGWFHDWQSNLTMISAPGGMNDPRPAVVGSINPGNVVSLQAVFSIFNEDARFYNLASYAVCSVPIVLWIVYSMRREFSERRAWFALAAIAPYTMLVTYHRVYDAKLLLLCIPACSMLWVRRDVVSRIALVFTAFGIILNADVPLAVLNILVNKLNLTTADLAGRLLTTFVARPNQAVLLLMGVFYLWVYLRNAGDQVRDAGSIQMGVDSVEKFEAPREA